MSVGRQTRLFFDASCLLAAAGSPGGGSGFLLSLVDRNFLKVVVSPGVLIEAARNVRNKMGALELATFHRRLPEIACHSGANGCSTRCHD
jgi:hypothetical protein